MRVQPLGGAFYRIQGNAKMATLEQRVGQLEGAYQHLATKADLAQLDRHGYCAALGLGGPLW